MSRPRAFDWDEAARLYAQCGNYAEVARQLGVSANSVNQALVPEHRRRQQNYQRSARIYVAVCPDCGGPASNRWQGTRCKACHDKRLATSVRPGKLRCTLCRLWLPDAEFGTSLQRPLRRGRHEECRPCHAARKRDQRARARATA